MSKQTVRRSKRRLIQAAAKPDFLRAEPVTIEWVKAAEGEPAGPAKYTMTAYTGGAMQVNAWGEPVVIDLTGLQAAGDQVPNLLFHDPMQIVGHADRVEITAQTLKLSGVISGGGPAAEQVAASAKAGFPWKASVGVRPEKVEYVEPGASAKANGKSFSGPVSIVRAGTLYEVSFVPFGADGKTQVRVAAEAANNKEPIMDPKLREWIEAMGLDADSLRPDQLAKLEAKHKTEVKASAVGSAAPPTFDLPAISLTYEKHVAAVEAKAASYSGKIEAGALGEILAKAKTAAIEAKSKALNEEWPAAKLEVVLVKAAADAEVDLIRAERPKGPAIHAPARDATGEVLQCAFARTAGLNVEKHYKPEVLAAADKHRGFGLQEMLLHHAIQAGYQPSRYRVDRSNLKEVLKAAFSVHTVTTLLTDLGHKMLLDGWTQAPQTWRNIAQTRPVTDFKTWTMFRLTTALEYQELGPGGEIQHGTASQESYTLQAKTYARMLALTREDIVNDDLGAFNDLRNRLGLGAALKLNKVVWTAWLAASNAGTFWTGARGNLVTSSALGETGLNTAVAAFRDMQGPDGNLLGLEPDRILVPSALEATARKLYVSQEMRDTTATTKFQTANIYFNRFTPIVVPELGNSNYTGYSATTWWLACNPATLASLLVGFLNGVETPTIESAEADFSTLGIQLRGYHDFGVNVSEYRASVKATA